MRQCYSGLILLWFVFASLQGQQFFNSPYTRFGLGQINDGGFASNQAMGGLTAGYRVKNTINYLNPASYTATDTLSFVFDAGLQGGFMKVTSSTGSNTSKILYLDHIAMLFPATKWWGLSMGIVPFSRSGYEILGSTSDTTYRYIYSGNGGLSQFYIGSAVRIGKHISLGLNFSYIFGPIERTRNVILNNEYAATTKYSYKGNVNNIFFNYGIQYFTTIARKHSLVVGGSLSNDTEMKSTYSEVVTRYHSFYGTDTLLYSGKKKGTVLFPMKWGIGFTYNYSNQFTIGFDYHTADWSKTLIFGQPEPLTTNKQYRFGMQFIPVPLTKIKRTSYPERFYYRLGGVYEKTNLILGGKQIYAYGMSFGVGIPWKNERKLFTNTTFNITYEFRVKGLVDEKHIKETYNMFTVGLTMHDFWFIKPKYD